MTPNKATTMDNASKFDLKKLTEGLLTSFWIVVRPGEVTLAESEGSMGILHRSVKQFLTRRVRVNDGLTKLGKSIANE
jgi:hypothetical protein